MSGSGDVPTDHPTLTAMGDATALADCVGGRVSYIVEPERRGGPFAARLRDKREFVLRDHYAAVRAALIKSKANTVRAGFKLTALASIIRVRP